MLPSSSRDLVDQLGRSSFQKECWAGVRAHWGICSGLRVSAVGRAKSIWLRIIRSLEPVGCGIYFDFISGTNVFFLGFC